MTCWTLGSLTGKRCVSVPVLIYQSVSMASRQCIYPGSTKWCLCVCQSVSMSICHRHMNPFDCTRALYGSCVKEEDLSLRSQHSVFTPLILPAPHSLSLSNLRLFSFEISDSLDVFFLSVFFPHTFFSLSVAICSLVFIYINLSLTVFLMTAATHNPTGGLL